MTCAGGVPSEPTPDLSAVPVDDIFSRKDRRISLITSYLAISEIAFVLIPVQLALASLENEIAGF